VCVYVEREREREREKGFYTIFYGCHRSSVTQGILDNFFTRLQMDCGLWGLVSVTIPSSFVPSAHWIDVFSMFAYYLPYVSLGFH
jgi:hypothetical protein